MKGTMITLAAGGAVNESRANRLMKAAIRAAGRYLRKEKKKKECERS
jgi:hypothetical protein